MLFLCVCRWVCSDVSWCLYVEYDYHVLVCRQARQLISRQEMSQVPAAVRMMFRGNDHS